MAVDEFLGFEVRHYVAPYSRACGLVVAEGFWIGGLKP